MILFTVQCTVQVHYVHSLYSTVGNTLVAGTVF